MASKRPPLQVMETPTTEVKSIQRCFETAPSPTTIQQLEASENISASLQQNLTTRQFGAELSFPGIKRENVTVTLIRSLRTALIAATEPGTNTTILKMIEFPPQVKYDTVQINMSIDGQLIISAKEALVHLPPPPAPATEVPHQSMMKTSSSELKTDNNYVMDTSKHLDCELISQGAIPVDAVDMTGEILATLSDDGQTWTFELIIPDGYAPEELSTQVTPETNTVVIVGKRWGVGKQAGKKKWLEFWRKFELPENVKSESITQGFSQDRKKLIVTAQTDDSGNSKEKNEKKDTETKADKLNRFRRVLP